jgi:hypothetical protein
MYCLHDGKVAQIIRTVRALAPEEQFQYPSEMTLYRYEQQFRWKERFQKIRRSVIEQAAKENAMVWHRINRTADLVLLGLTKRLTDALQRSAAGEEGALDVFTADLFYKLWEIHRTERGLPTRVNEQNGRLNIEPIEERRRSLENAGMGKAVEYVRKASPEVLRRILREMGMDRMETPAILR